MGIDKDKSLLTTAAELRRHAEEQLRVKTAELQPPRTNDEALKLVHELQVHQIELEMQNEELRQARDEVDAALEKFTDLYDFAPIGYFTLDRGGIVRSVNLTGASFLSVERSRLLGRRFELFVAAEARMHFSEFLEKVFVNQGKASCEVTLTTEVNHPYFVHIEGVGEASGKESRIAVLDITKRRLAEDAVAKKRLIIEELNKTLEERIIQAVSELHQKDQMLVLQERRALMGEMINNIAHQWRQPLNTLGLLIQALPLHYDSAEFGREFLEENSEKGMQLIQHMSQTIDDFRNFFISDKEKVTFGVNQVIGRTLSLIEKTFQDQQIGIAFHSEFDPMVNGYPNEYAQVLLNILMNARDALVGHNVENALISIHAVAEGGTSVVTITDNAGGIAEEIIDRLFDPYFSTKGPDNGTGIGLYMSKTIIEKNMGGRLTVRNTESGAEFRIEV